MSRTYFNIDSFWLFMIGIFVFIPAIKMITGYQEGSEKPSSDGQKVVAVSNGVLEISSNSATVKSFTEIKIPIKEGTVIVNKISPDRGEPDFIPIKGKYAITSFDQTGDWEINMYDINNLLVEWIKITVY